jgi:hypothetical protein
MAGQGDALVGGQSLIPLEQIGARRATLPGHTGGRRQRYYLDDAGRKLVLALYDGSSSRITELAERLHVPRHTVKKWGRELGLARQKEPPWTETEILYLESHLCKESVASIARTLGRTSVAVRLKARRIGINKIGQGHTMRGLELALGVDHHKIERWIKEGWLVGARRETERAHNDFWYFSDADIRAFVLAHPLEIDQRRMDWLYMVDLLSGGRPVTIDATPPKKEIAMKLDVEDRLQLDIDTLARKNIAILGITQSGKTNTAMVLIEELFANSIPLTIVDIDGEYRHFKERFSLVIAGTGEHVEYHLSRESAGELATRSITEEQSVLLDMSEYEDLSECRLILMAYLEALWREAGRLKRPYQIVLEEAHEWLPEEGATTALKVLLARIAARGLRRGLRLMLISQRSSKVDKNSLSQTALLFLHKVVHPADYAVYQQLIPLSTREVGSLTASLKVGQAIVVHDSMPQMVWIRKAGGDRHEIDIKTVLRKRVKELEEQVSEQDACIRHQADLLARLEAAYPEIMDTLCERQEGEGIGVA